MPKESVSLTGGSGDVNPQLLTGVITQTGADAITSGSFALPIQRLQNQGKAQVVELLKAWVRWPVPPEADSQIQVAFSTSDLGTAAAAAFNNPKIFAMFSTVYRITTSGAVQINRQDGIDLTDGAGHGIIIATDQFWAQVDSGTTSLANAVSFKFLYRFKNVTYVEYIGVVQSQQ